MSVPTLLQSKSIPLMISLDGGVTYQMVVCKRASNFNGTTATNSEDTDCGTFSSTGSPAWNVDFEGAVNVTPTTGTEISFAQLLAAWNNGVKVYLKFQTGNGLGSQVYIQGGGYISDFAFALQTGSLAAFSMTIQGDGLADITI